MKKYFYIITIEIIFRPTGVKTLDTQKFSCRGLIEIEAKEDNPSLIYDKILKKSMVGWENSTIISRTIEFYNFWEEKEAPVSFEDLPIEEWNVSPELISALKDLPVKTFRDLSKYSEGDLLSISFRMKKLVELKSFLKTKGFQLFKVI